MSYFKWLEETVSFSDFYLTKTKTKEIIWLQKTLTKKPKNNTFLVFMRILQDLADSTSFRSGHHYSDAYHASGHHHEYEHHSGDFAVYSLTLVF